MRALAWFSIAVALVFQSGCRSADWIERTLVTVDVTGVWEGSYNTGPSPRTGVVMLVLQQQGQRVTGDITLFGVGRDPSGTTTINGTVNGDTFSFQQAGGPDVIQIQLQVNSDEMTGSGRRQGMELQMNVRRRPQ